MFKSSLPGKTTFLTLPMWKFLKQKKTIYQTFRQKNKKKNKERNSYSVHETGKKVFFSNTHGCLLYNSTSPREDTLYRIQSYAWNKKRTKTTTNAG